MDGGSGVTVEEATVSERAAPRRILRWLLQAIVVGVTLAYVISALWGNWGEVARLNLDLNPAYLGGALGMALLYLLGRGLLWDRIVSRLVGAHPRAFNVACWLISVLGKYVPGKVFLLVARLYMYRERGASAALVLVGTLVEAMVLFLSTALLLAGATLTTALDVSPLLRHSLAVAALALLLVAHPRVLRWGISILAKLRKTELTLPEYRLADGLRWTLHMVLSWLVLGTGMYLLARSLVYLPPAAVLQLTAAFAVAAVSGTFAVLAPAGIGVREAALTALLTPLMGAGPAAALAILARLWITLAELSAGLVATPMLRRIKRREAPQ